MADTKRKNPPANAGPAAKRKKGGNSGRWRTTHQNEVASGTGGERGSAERGSVEPGDVGIWVTCARGMEGKAGSEVNALFQKYAKTMYGIQPPDEAAEEAAFKGSSARGDGAGAGTKADADADADDDIESLIQKELAYMRHAPKAKSHHFSRVRLGMECVLFIKTQPPIDPVSLAHRVSLDAKRDAEAAAVATEAALANGTEMAASARPCRYVNRLTPITLTGRATTRGIEEVARTVLAPYFKLVPPAVTAGAPDADEEGDQEGSSHKDDDGKAAAGDEKPPHSFAIRPSFRRHDNLDRLGVINQVAGLIDQDHHKVNLENPDRVILIEICMHTCGMSVVEGDWNNLRKYNLSELYSIQHKSKQRAGETNEAKGAT